MTTINAVSQGDSNLGEYIRLKDACRLFPGQSGKALSIATIYRWATIGVRGSKLRVAQVGSGLCTTKRWAEDFIDTLTKKRLERLGQTEEKSEQEPSRAAIAAGKELESCGL